jgi:hypothetical protein
MHSSGYKFNREGDQGDAFDFRDPTGPLTLGGSKTGYWVTKRVR